jgi:apolipoprotein N-acyltransferase
LRGFLPLSRPLAVAFALGGLSVLGFAPFHLFYLPVLTLAVLFHLWQRTDSRSRAAIGFAFGAGFFLLGVSWVYVSLHDFGGMPAPLAAVSTLLFCLFLALFPAAVGAMGVVRSPARTLLCLLPATWAGAEWVRGFVFTGFPWLVVGYAAVPESPLMGYAPVLGVYGVSLLMAVSAGLLVLIWRFRCDARRGLGAVAALVALWAAGALLNRVEWTRPVGEVVSVSLLQGNIPQDIKWREERVAPTLATYARLVEESPSRLILLPETAFPLFLDQLPPAYLERLAAHARRVGGDVVFGVPERSADGSRYYNSVVSLGVSDPQTYRKVHLVPFGEFLPLRPLFGWLLDFLHIPLGDFTAGSPGQPPLAVAGQRLATNICYEDVFGEELLASASRATLLANVSNDAWFGDSIAPRQHLQIAQMRAAEMRRMMLRATNTGITALIDAKGRVIARLEPFHTGALHVTAQGRFGETPYMRLGNGAAVGLMVFLLFLAVPRSGRLD